ncbi:hypothetical protein BGW80DRAFT_1330828, partial [Lactifluus volemus]
MHADAMGQFLPPFGTSPGLGSTPGVTKRIITLTYMGNVHDGRSHWFHTIIVSRYPRH